MRIHHCCNCVVVIHEKYAGHVTEWSDLIGLALFFAGKLLYFEEEGKMDASCGSTVEDNMATFYGIEKIYKIC